MRYSAIVKNRHIKELLTIAKELDVKVKWNFSKKRKCGIFHFLKRVRGGDRVRINKPYISIFPYHYKKIEDVVFALAHELQHKMHHKYGLYKSYYQPYPINMGVAVRAERDCDKYGTVWAKKINPRFRRGKYKSTNVWFYDEYMEEIWNQ